MEIAYIFYKLRNFLALAGRGEGRNSWQLTQCPSDDRGGIGCCWHVILTSWYRRRSFVRALRACVWASRKAADTTIMTRVNVSKDQFYGLRHIYGRRAMPGERSKYNGNCCRLTLDNKFYVDTLEFLEFFALEGKVVFLLK